jgi:hypothetical protein
MAKAKSKKSPNKLGKMCSVCIFIILICLILQNITVLFGLGDDIKNFTDADSKDKLNIIAHFITIGLYGILFVLSLVCLLY